MTQESSRLDQKALQLPDGPEQRGRDDVMRAGMAMELEGKSTPFPKFWAYSMGSRSQTPHLRGVTVAQ